LTVSPKARAQAIATGRGGGQTLAIPLALRLAARINERALDAFFADPTQLANGLGDLYEAVRPDGVVVTLPEVVAADLAATDPADLARGVRCGCALEATRRLRQTLGDAAALTAVLPGPASLAARWGVADPGTVIVALMREFLGAGVDVVVFVESETADLARFAGALSTAANMARFHRAVAALIGPPAAGLGTPTVVAVGRPAPATGLVVTDGEVPPDTSVVLVRDWLATVRSTRSTPYPGLARM